MFFISLLALAGLAAAVPAPASHLCSESGLKGDCVAVSAVNHCEKIPAPVAGTASSLLQPVAIICDYFTDDTCSSPDKLHGDFTGGPPPPWTWPVKGLDSLGTFDNRLRSVSCVAASAKRDLQARGTLAPAAVEVYTEPNFGGQKTAVDALSKCSQNFNAGVIKSFVQPQGFVCRYYRIPNCDRSSHDPVLRLDSTNTPWYNADLGEWSGKIVSFECELVAP